MTILQLINSLCGPDSAKALKAKFKGILNQEATHGGNDTLIAAELNVVLKRPSNDLITVQTIRDFKELKLSQL